MTGLADRVETVVLVMLENRSFDHMLGHLSYEKIVPTADGLRKPLKQYENLYQGDIYSPFRLKDGPLPFDPPHEHDTVAVQLARSTVNGQYTMTGFVEAYAKATGINPGPRPEPMGFFTSDQVPVTSFLARHFCTCDHWFSPLPTSTQPNRNIAFSGTSRHFDTKTRLLSYDDIIFDWLERSGVRWRVYHDGLSYFAIYPSAWNHVLGSNFRDFEFLFRDMSVEPAATRPQVVIVEPSYANAPHFGPDHPNDNHAPLAAGWGEEFLRRTYQAVIANPARWAKTVMLVYYDEHGGFWDHVPPPGIGYTTTGNPALSFESLGPRIPAIVVSPLVEPGAVCKALLDHTSVLQFVAEVFTPGKPYSASVNDRRMHGIASVAAALTREAPRADTPAAPADPIRVATALGDGLATPPANELAGAFEEAASRLLAERPEQTGEKYPELFQWKAAVEAARPKTPV